MSALRPEADIRLAFNTTVFVPKYLGVIAQRRAGLS
jgi:hypothetical protein